MLVYMLLSILHLFRQLAGRNYCTAVGMLPEEDADAFSLFPTQGVVDCEGIKI